MPVGVNQSDHPNFTDIWTKLNADLDDIVEKFQADSQPTTTAPFMWWFDTTNSILKLRNEADDAWINLFYIDGSDNLYASGPLRISQNSDTVTISHDGTDVSFQWSDGELIIQTDEGTNTDTIVAVKGKGTGKGIIELWDQSTTNKVAIKAADAVGADRVFQLPSDAPADGEVLTADGTSGTTKWEAGSGGLPQGYVGIDCLYVGTSSVSISSGRFACDGTDYMVSAANNLDFSGAGLGASSWYCITFDPDLCPGSTASAACFSAVSVASFAYDDADQAWMRTTVGQTNQRAVSLIRTDGSGDLLPFRVLDRYFSFDTPLEFLNTSSSATSWTALDTLAPDLSGARLHVTIHGRCVTTSNNLHYLSVQNGDCSSAIDYSRDVLACGYNYGGTNAAADGQGSYVTDSIQQVRYRTDTSANAYLHLFGFWMPRGL